MRAFLPSPGSTIRLDRRAFMTIAAGLVASGALPKSVLALAGPHGFKQGAYDLTVVSDGTLTLPLSVVSPDAKPEDLKMLMGALVKDDKFTAEVNVVLAKAGTEVILIDSGPGKGFQDSAGHLADSLKAAGTELSAITKVIYTHAHPDHLWGTLGGDGKPVYPNASFHVAENEWNFWTTPDLASKMPKDMEAMVKRTQGQLAAIKDKVSFFTTGQEIVSGMSAIDTAGHTPGHVSFEFSGGDGLIITGDAVVVPSVFFAHPEWKFGFDADGATAGANRRKLLDIAASGKKLMLGYHWPYPGLGRAEVKDGAFQFVAAT